MIALALSELVGVCGFLSSDLLDQRVSKLNFRFRVALQACRVVFVVTERNTENLCGDTVLQLFNAYSIASVVSVQDTNDSEVVWLSDELMNEMAVHLVRTVSDPVPRSVVDFVSRAPPTVHANPMSPLAHVEQQA